MSNIWFYIWAEDMSCLHSSPIVVGQTPHEWLLLGPSDTGHRLRLRWRCSYWRWHDGIYAEQMVHAAMTVVWLSWPSLSCVLIAELFLNLRTCPYLCSCGLVKRHQSQPKYCSNSKSASSQVRSKCPDVFLLRPFYRGCIGRWLVWTWAAKYPRMHFAHKPVAPFIHSFTTSTPT